MTMLSSTNLTKTKVVLNMETGDIDDSLSFIFAATHPALELIACTVYPGSKLQIGFLQTHLLQPLGLDIPVGAFDLKYRKDCIDPKFYEKVFGSFCVSDKAESGADILLKYCDQNTTFISGAPLSTLRIAVEKAKQESREFTIGRLFVQGGFAGKNLVHPDFIAPNLVNSEFVGDVQVAGSYNFNGDRGAALLLQQYPGFLKTMLVSKNVCHRVFWDKEVHDCIDAVKSKNQGLAKMWKIMDNYIRQGTMKKIHDLFCVCCAIDPQIGIWAPVHIESRSGKWGSVPNPDSRVSIITDYDRQRFLDVLTLTV